MATDDYDDGDAPEECFFSQTGKCLRKVLVDGAGIVAAYAAIVYVVDGRVLHWRKIATFYFLFGVLAAAFRFMDADLDQLTRVAAFQLGIKLFSALG